MAVLIKMGYAKIIVFQDINKGIFFVTKSTVKNVKSS